MTKVFVNAGQGDFMTGRKFVKVQGLHVNHCFQYKKNWFTFKTIYLRFYVKHWFHRSI